MLPRTPSAAICSSETPCSAGLYCAQARADESDTRADLDGGPGFGGLKEHALVFGLEFGRAFGGLDLADGLAGRDAGSLVDEPLQEHDGLVVDV